MSPRRRVLSMIQSTSAAPHLGNFVGALRSWKRLQDDPTTECYFSIADLHALTTAKDPAKLERDTRSMAAFLMACGLEHVFVQSALSKEHCTLMWILSATSVSVPWLERMTQFKAKTAAGGGGGASFGLLAYPVLQAADILLYDANIIPVGADQIQHVELVRDAARTFNDRFGENSFVLPQALVDEFPSIKSLKNPSNKMSKSDPSPNGTLWLSDSNDAIRKKINRAKTDDLGVITKDLHNRPEVQALVSLLSACDSESDISSAAGWEMSKLKKTLGDAVVKEIEPVRERALELLENEQVLDAKLEKGAMRARIVASEKLASVAKKVGLSYYHH